MSYIIKAAFIRIDLEDYVKGIESFPGFITGSIYSIDPSEEIIVDVYETIEDAEAKINQCVNVSINDQIVQIEYEYLQDSETVYFNKVAFKGVVYHLDSDMFSKSCYEAIKNYLV